MTMKKTNKITAEIISLLKLYGVRAWRNNTGAISRGGRFIKFGLPGSPDIIGYTNKGRFLGIEFKNSETSDILSSEQIDFCSDAINCDCLICVASSVKEVELFLKKYNI